MVLPDTLLANTQRIFQLTPVYGSMSSSKVQTARSGNTIVVSIEEKPFFNYRGDPGLPHPDRPAHYTGSGFIHPLYSPGGKILTDGFPAGHAHQNGIFSAWTRAIYKGDTVDFWNRQQLRGKVEHLRVDTVLQGLVATQVQTTGRFVSLKHGDILHETRTVTVYPFGDAFVLDMELVQKNITTDTLFIPQYHYGGFALRGSRTWNPDDVQHFSQHWNLLTSTGIQGPAANDTHAEWVSIWGDTGEGVAGVAVFSHPDNFRHPQAIRVHPSMPYWCFCPCIDGPFFIAPDQPFIARYRYFSFDGVPDMVLIRTLSQAYDRNSQITVSLQ